MTAFDPFLSEPRSVEPAERVPGLYNVLYESGAWRMDVTMGQLLGILKGRAIDIDGNVIASGPS